LEIRPVEDVRTRHSSCAKKPWFGFDWDCDGSPKACWKTLHLPLRKLVSAETWVAPLPEGEKV